MLTTLLKCHGIQVTTTNERVVVKAEVRYHIHYAESPIQQLTTRLLARKLYRCPILSRMLYRTGPRLADRSTAILVCYNFLWACTNGSSCVIVLFCPGHGTKAPE
jgi:hypothetical protein